MSVSDKNSQVLWKWESEAFGDSKPQIETIKQPLRFAGQYSDDEVGLFYNYFRFYNPETGRYIENDPIDLQGGLNRYGYVNGNPLHNIDPKGLAQWTGGYVEGSVDFAKMPIPIIDIGTKGFHFTLQSQCEIGVDKKYTIQILGILLGVNIDHSLLRRVSYGVGTAVFDDNNGKQPNPQAFNGFFGIANVSLVATTTFVSATQMGRATGNINGFGLSTDFYALEAYGGYAHVLEVKEESCNCE